MNRLLVTSAAAALFAGVASHHAIAFDMPSAEGSCSASTPDEIIDQEHAEEAWHIEQGKKNGAAEKKALEEAHADELARAEAAAKVHRKDNPPPKGMHASVVNTSEIRPGDTAAENTMTVQYSVEYRAPRFRNLLVREARFDGTGGLIADELTPIGKVWLKADSYAVQVPGGHCSPSLGVDLDGDTFVSEVVVMGPGRGGERIERAHLWFNAAGEAYRGALFDEAGGNKGGFEEARNYPQQGLEGGALALVEVPRSVTYVCAECQPAADRRNGLAQEMKPLAEQVNWIANDYNTKQAAAEAARAKALASPDPAVRNGARDIIYRELGGLRASYVRDRRSYDAAMAELSAAHDAYIACDKACRAPVPEETAVLASDNGADAPPPAEDDWTFLNAFGGGGYVSYRMPALDFLGRERPGATAPTLGLAASERTLTGSQYQFGFTLVEGGADMGWLREGAGEIRDSVFFRVRGLYSEADSSADFPLIDLGGDRLVVPGTGEGPNGNGFVLGYFNGLNALRDATIERNFRSFELEFRAGTMLESDIAALQMLYGADFSYASEDHGAAFTGAVPGFGRDIGYDQEIEVDRFGAGLFFLADYMIDEGLWIGAEAKAEVVYFQLSGEETLSFTGFSEQVVEDDGTELGATFSMSAYMDVAIGANASIVIAAGAFEGRNNAPVWKTPGGGERAGIEMEDASGWYGRATFTVYFE